MPADPETVILKLIGVAIALLLLARRIKPPFND